MSLSRLDSLTGRDHLFIRSHQEHDVRCGQIEGKGCHIVRNSHHRWTLTMSRLLVSQGGNSAFQGGSETREITLLRCREQIFLNHQGYEPACRPSWIKRPPHLRAYSLHGTFERFECLVHRIFIMTMTIFTVSVHELLKSTIKTDFTKGGDRRFHDLRVNVLRVHPDDLTTGIRSHKLVPKIVLQESLVKLIAAAICSGEFLEYLELRNPISNASITLSESSSFCM